MNYITIVSRSDFYFSSVLSLTHTLYPTKCLRLLQAIKMLLFIANVSVKSSFCCPLCSPKQLRVWRIDCPLDWKSTLIVSLTFSQTRRWAEQNSAFKTHLNFASLCKSSLLIGALFLPPPTILIFFSRFSLSSIVVFVWRECVHVCTPLEKERKKTFGKLIAGKKEMISRKKECIQPPRWRRKNAERKNVLPVYGRWIHKHF